jgi:hypothetical protein
MVTIRSASKTAASRASLRLVAGRKTALLQDNKAGNAGSDVAANQARSRGPKPAADAPAAPVILWDDPVGSATNGDQEG